MKRCKKRRGIVLLQVLVMSVVLGILSIGILRWVLSRKYMVRQMGRSSGAGNAVSTCLNEFNAWMEGGGSNQLGVTAGPCSPVPASPSAPAWELWAGCSEGSEVWGCRVRSDHPWTIAIESDDLVTY